MRPSTRRDGARLALGLGLAGLFASLVALLVGSGLEHADQLSSVIGMLIGLLGLIVAVVALRSTRTRAPTVVVRTAWGKRRVRRDVLDLLTATSSAADMPNMLMTDDRHMAVSTTYVRQRVEVPRSETSTDARRTELTPFLPPDQQPRALPVRRPLDGTLDSYRHLFLEGGPGSGKSTTAAQMCHQLAEGWLREGAKARALSAEPVLPILITARQLAEHAASPWADALTESVTASLGKRLAQRIPAHVLTDAVDGVPWLIVVDGLDEVPADERTTLIGQLTAWAVADDPRYRLLVTSRPLTGSASALLGTGTVGHYTLVPFDRALLTDYARRWFAAEGAPDANGAAARFVSQVRASGLLDVAATPLLAGVAIKVYADSPDRSLPRNRHDLYERYLQYLESLNRDRRASAREKLSRLLAPGSGRSVADGLYERLDELIKHLAVERVTSRNPLIPRAVAWLAARGVPESGPPPLRWSDHIVEALAATGLITRRGNTIDFLHLTFAEHLAAHVHAEELPGRFEPTHQAWRRWVSRAREEDHGTGTAVLTRWTRDHSPVDLLDSLLAGAQPANLVAVRLVTEGATPTPAQLEACLLVIGDRIRRAPDTEPWESIRRLPQAAVVSAWLSELLAGSHLSAVHQVALVRVQADRAEHDQPDMLARLSGYTGPGQPAAAVAAAAEAIIEVAPSRTEEVAAALRLRLHQLDCSRRDRVTLAAALLECGSAHRSAALDTLRSVMTHPKVLLPEAKNAAETLAEAGAEGREQITSFLNDLIRRDRTAAHDRVAALETLVALESGRRDSAVALLREVAASEYDIYPAVSAAVTLARLAPAQRAEMVDRLTEIAGNPSTFIHYRIAAAGRLLNLDAAAAPVGAELICTLGISPSLGLQELPAMTEWLTNSEVATRSVTVRRLRETRDGTSIGSLRRQLLTIAMAACDARYHQEAETAVRDIVADPRSVHELLAVGDLIEFLSSSAVDRVVPSLVAWARSDTQPVLHRTELMEMICRSIPRHAAEVLSVAREVVSSGLLTEEEQAALLALEIQFDPGWSFTGPEQLRPLRRLSQVALHGVMARLTADHRHRSAIQAEMYGWLTDRHLDFYGRTLIALTLDQGESADRDEIDRLRVRLLGERAPYEIALVNATDMVTRRGGLIVQPTISLLNKIVVDLDAPPWARVQGARQLAVLAPNDGKSIETLRSIVQHPAVALGDKSEALLELAALLGSGSEEPRKSLIDIIDNLPEVPYGNETIMKAVLRLAPDRSDLVLVYAYRALNDHEYGTLQAARTLAELHEGNRVLHELQRQLQRQGEAARRDVKSLLRAAEHASWVYPDSCPEVAAALVRIAGDKNATSAQRIKSLEVLCGRTDRSRGKALRMLRTAACARMVKDPAENRFDSIDALSAAEVLLKESPALSQDTGLVLHAFIADPGETTGRRYRAARALLKHGAMAHRLAVLRVAGADLKGLGADLITRCGLAALICRFDRAHRVEAGRFLSGLLASGPPKERQVAAATLLRLEPGHEQAFRTLGELVLEDLGSVSDAAAESLLEGTGEHREALADMLRPLVQDTDALRTRVRAARIICRAVPSDKHEAMAVLREVAVDTAAASVHRVAAAHSLASVGWYTPDRDLTLGGLLADQSLPGWERSKAGSWLGYLPGPERRDARRDVLRLADLDGRLAAAGFLVDMPGQCQDDAVAALRVLVGAAGLKPPGRLRAAGHLIDHGGPEDRAAAAIALGELADDLTVHGWVRTRALVELNRSGAADASEAARRLHQRLNDPATDVEMRRWSAEGLAEIDGMYSRHARDALLKSAAGMSDKRTAARLHRSARKIDLLGVSLDTTA